MTHKSSLRYGQMVTVDKGSGAKSGPVRVSYFDPATGNPLKAKPRPRAKRKRNRPALKPGTLPVNAVAVTLGGVPYESMRAAHLATGVSLNTLQMARKMGWAEVGGMPVSFA